MGIRTRRIRTLGNSFKRLSTMACKARLSNTKETQEELRREGVIVKNRSLVSDLVPARMMEPRNNIGVSDQPLGL
jgi:hypothetical protein